MEVKLPKNILFVLFRLFGVFGFFLLVVRFFRFFLVCVFYTFCFRALITLKF